MITRFLPTLAAKIAGGIALDLLLALVASRFQIGALERQNANLLTRIEVLNRDLSTCRGNGARLEAGLASQNAAVDSARAAGAERVADLERSLSAARRTAQDAQSRAQVILARRPGADQCADALNLMRGE